MHKRWWLVGMAGMLFASGCNSMTSNQPKTTSIASNTDINSSPTSPANPNSTEAQPLAANDFFPDPLVAGSTSLQPVPVPHLIPPTTSIERVPQVDTGRPDPFASLGYTPTVVQPQQPSSPAPAPPVVLPSAPIVTTVAAAPPVTPLPLLPPSLSLAPLPSVTVPSQITPPRSAAETIEISGVIEVGGKTNVIVKVPEEETSRYVTVGDRLANGKVLVKRVEMGLEPVVILEQGGREVVRSVGSSSALVGAL
jgi:hypothetical protein